MPKKTSEEKPDTPPPQRRGLSKFKWLLVLVAVLTLAPSLATFSGQHAAIMGFVAPKLRQAVTFDSISTHWWAPVQLTGVSVKDLSLEPGDAADETPLMTIESVSISQPLWRVALSMGRGIDVTLKRPVVNLRVTEGQTNVERTVAEIFGASTDSNDDSFPIAVNVEDGKVRLLPSGLNVGGPEIAVASIDGINGRLSTIQTKAGLPEVKIAASLRSSDLTTVASSAQPRTQPKPNTRIAAALDDITSDQPLLPFTEAEVAELRSTEADAALKIEVEPAGENGQHCLIEAHGVELSKIEPLLQRLLPDTRWDGKVSCRFDGLITNAAAGPGFAGRTGVRGVDVRWRANWWAIGESIELPDVTIQGAYAVAEDGILVTGLKVSSALLDASGDGEVRLAKKDPVHALQDAAAGRSIDEQSVVNEAAAATTGKVTLHSRLNVAALAAMLPRTLHLGEGVSIDSAEVRTSCRLNSEVAKPEGQLALLQKATGFRWQLASETSPIRATKDGRSIQVDSSVRLDAVGSVSASSFGLDRARVSGTFGTVDVSPEGGGYAINGEVRPQQLWNQVKAVLDIPRPGITGDVQLASKLNTIGDAIRLSDTTLRSKELTVSSQQLTLRPSRPLLEMVEGDLVVQGSSAAIKTLIAPWHSAWWLGDQSGVSAQLQAIPGQKFGVRATIQPIGGAASNDSYLQIRDGRAALNLTADSATGSFILQNSTVEVPGLAANLTGTISAPGGVIVTNLDADTQYDLSVLSRSLLGSMADDVQLHGTGRQTIALRGSPMLWTTAEVARQFGARIAVDDAAESTVSPFAVVGRIPFSGGRLYGLPLGPGEINAQLKEGLLRAEPIHCTLGSGELDVMPQWDLNRGVIQLASGSRVRNLQVTPELCGEWLGYVAPMMSDAASVQGTLSARIQRFDYFVDHPTQSSVQGVLTIHNASASPGSSLGPLLQLLQLAGRESIAGRHLELPPQDVQVELNQGMVTHQGLELQLADYRMTSSGTVGLNKQIQLVLDVPLERSSADQRGRSLRIPVGGTVGQPALNTQGLLQNLGRQEIDKTINNQLDRGLNRLLDKLR